MSESVETVCRRVRERVTPDADEQARMEAAVTALTDRVEAAIDDLPVAADVIQVGSTARGTWLAGDRDIDIFVRFPADIDRADLEEYGLAVGRDVLPDGREEYAEHPYTVGEIDGFDVDLVPCYDVADASEIQSAVDRTPFHTAYVEERLDEALAGEVRLCKQFCTGIGVYGSDLRTRGFSGYLVELLILEYGGFRELVEAAADWRPPVRFDPEGHGETTFEDPLVVVDPTDPERNVAAVAAPDSVARFQHYARELLADPRESLFVPSDPDPLDAAGVEAAVESRGTTPVAVVFDTPDLVEDDLYPQLRKSLGGVVGELDRRGFGVLRSRVLADDDRAVLFAECQVPQLPAVERHEGPPVHVRDHAGSFFEAYADGDATGPFVDGDRYVVERERAVRRPEALLASDAIFDVALGVAVERQLRGDYSVLSGTGVASLAERFGTELAGYFDPRP
jgi:tRNA nucleotidyltransferase (CCA-adding enzyme)